MPHSASISKIAQPQFRKLAEQLDKLGASGNRDGAISTTEVDSAIAAAQSDPARFGEIAALRSLRTFVVHCGEPENGNANPLGGGGYNPVAMRSATLTGTDQSAKAPVLLGEPRIEDSCTQVFQVPQSQRDLADRQSALVPLEAKELHLIELKYQDTRPLRDLEFNYRNKGEFNWQTTRGDDWFDLKKREKAGEIDVKRERDHNAPWINNPIRVHVDVLFPDGRVHSVGKKFLDFHVHDAHSPDSSGYPETDNISNGYERLPRGKLPEGCLLRLTPMHENRKPWEQDRSVAANLSWVKPIYKPDFVEQARVHEAASWEKPKADGYEVDPTRTIAAVLVTWTDHGGISSGSVSMQGDQGSWRSPRYNIGSGETELIPVDRKASDGRIRIEGRGMELKRVEVLYAD